MDRAMSLNPCSNGIQKYNVKHMPATVARCLNPCSNGIQKYGKRMPRWVTLLVLILVLMEYKNTLMEGNGLLAENGS